MFGLCCRWVFVFSSSSLLNFVLSPSKGRDRLKDVFVVRLQTRHLVCFQLVDSVAFITREDVDHFRVLREPPEDSIVYIKIFFLINNK